MSDTIKGGIITAFDLVSDEVKKTFREAPAVHEEQTDNVFDGGITCAITSLSMLCQSKGMKPGEVRTPQHLEDKILKDIRDNLITYKTAAVTLGLGEKTEQGLRTDFNFLKWYAGEKLGLKLKLDGLSYKQWISKIATTNQCFMSSTSSALTASGHIILIRGCFLHGDAITILANDPYGVYPYHKTKGGESVAYPASMFPDAGKTYYTLSYAD